MSKVHELKALVRDEKFLYIQTHNFPDPDAIASAFALQFILKQFDVKSKIIYSGYISGKTMNEMIEQLNIQVYHINKVKIEKDSKIILVDTQITHENFNHLDAGYIGCIDHHEKNSKKNNIRFIDILPNVGSSSAIISDYIQDLEINEIPGNIATALLIGIFIDTLRLSRKVSDLDIRAVYRLFPYGDITFLNYLTLNNIDIKDLQQFQKSIDGLKVIQDIGIVKVEDIQSPQLLPILCDFFIQLRELTLIIGYYIKRNRISISIRSEKKEYHASRIINAITKKIGGGGGHKTMAAGMIDMKKVRKNFNFENYLLDKIKQEILKA